MTESPGASPESPMEQDDVVYPCKGCGEILEEGKAFELAGNRWHIDCFRCNSCSTLLDSDANLLLLGDGSLICNNCTYSCNACGDKIEDLAILTGDQAFCASCFRCRNCKRKIENLRYARTSQGIFCMSCHESLMAKRRKHKKAQRQGQSTTKDKALPDLPRSESQTTVQSAFSPPSDMETPQTEKTNGSNRDGSPASHDDDQKAENVTLSSRIYKESRSLPKNKNTGSSSSYDGASGDDGLFVPFLLDTGPPVGVAPLAVKDRGFSESPNATPPSEHGMQPTNREYFQRKPALPTGRDVLREATRNASRSSSRERREVAIDERARQLANPINESVRRKRGGLDDVSPARPPRVQDPAPRVHDEANSSQAYATISSGQAEFKLQDVPKNRKAGGSRRGSKTDSKSPSQYSPSGDFSSGSLSPPHDFSASSFSPDSDKGRKLSAGQIMQNLVADPQTRGAVERPKRGDSLQAKQTLEVASVQSSGPTTPIAPVGFAHDRSNSSQSSRHAAESAAPPHLNGKMISQPMESPASRAILELPTAPPARSSSRPAPPDTFTSPRHAPHPPPPPSIERHKPSESTSTMQSDATSGLNLPRYSTGGDFSMEEDMARILRGDEGHNEPGVLRKMSNAVKHGRSFSDRGTRSQASSARWSGKSPMNGLDISSPTTAQSPDAKEDSATLRNELRRARQRITELEAEKNTIMHQSADLSEVSSQLQDKRNTMAFLNSQREIVVRELEIMTEHLQKAKDSNQPVNLKTLKTEVLHDLTYSIQRLKENLSKDVELLVKQKDDLTDEISKLIAMKDKGFQEYESLSSRNAQLTQHNNELIHGIQDFYKANRQPNGTSFDGGRPFLNGLGIQMHKDRPDGPSDARSMHGSESTVPGMSHDTENESVISTPKVIDIRKAPKGNMLKKGTQGFLRGVKGAFNADKERGIQRGSPFQTEGVPYNQMSETTLAPKSAQEAPGRQKFGAFFGVGDKANSSKVSNLKHSHFNNSSPSLASDAAGGAILFGIDLTTRCEMEKRVIPGIVTRCIEEVELRGMDVEGIYRKSGGNSQVNQVKGGFEANNEYDISDIELDIHAITSTLKQYFRRLPMPLISYDVYDPLLAAVKQEDTDVRIDKMRQCMDQLPRCHRDCLEFLMFHLSRVMEKEKYNLMSSGNLAVVFAPTILRPQTIEREMTDMQIQRTAVQFLLENSKVIFAEV